jgi:nascent polypeptide-associated complex subunit alpha
MFGGLDPKKMQAMMSQMGIKQVQIDSDEVVIKGKGKNIVIKNPSVVKITMSGQDSFQISGKVEESESNEISEDDIKTVMAQTKVTRDRALDALKKSGGDLAQAILSLRH